eukprot:440472-Prymnesium_polylepis.1
MSSELDPNIFLIGPQDGATDHEVCSHARIGLEREASAPGAIAKSTSTNEKEEDRENRPHPTPSLFRSTRVSVL